MCFQAKAQPSFMFMADNQFNNYLSSDGILRDITADNFISVAVRPPVLDLFAPDLMRLALKQDSFGRYLIHLGDGLNIACDSEFDRFKKTLSLKENSLYRHKGFVMLPGNHDHIYIGNSVGSNFIKKSAFRKAWAKGCNIDSFPQNIPKDIARDIMHKSKFVKSYLDLLFLQGKISRYRNDFPISKSSFKCSITPKKSRRDFYEVSTKMKFCEWKSPNNKSFLSRVYYELPETKDIRVSYRAKLVQMVNMILTKNKVKYIGILLDSTDYSKPPSFGGTLLGAGRNLVTGTVNPGLYGALSKYQTAIVDKWIKEEKEIVKKDSSIDEVRFIIMSHHPLIQFYGYSEKYLSRIINESPKSIFVTAHTHLGYLFKDIKYFFKFFQKNKFTEINIGSTTDFPPQFNLFEPGKSGGGKSLNASFNSYTINPSVKGLCKKLRPKKSYVNYRTRFINPTGGTYWELITFYKEMYKYMRVPFTDNPILKALKIADYSKCRKNKCLKEMFILLKRLHKYDDKFTSSKDNPYYQKRLEFGACHAFWASKDEKKKTGGIFE